jgi:hypothetical protein
MSGFFHSRGCTLWAVVALVTLLLLAGLLIYIDRRFGPEASAFFLGISLGIPLLLVIVVIVGGIYVLVIRGTVHLQERDDAGEIGRLRTLGELARSDRSYAQRDREALRLARRVAEGNPPALPATRPSSDWPTEGWDDGGWDDAGNGRSGQNYRIVE